MHVSQPEPNAKVDEVAHLVERLLEFAKDAMPLRVRLSLGRGAMKSVTTCVRARNMCATPISFRATLGVATAESRVDARNPRGHVH
jgi:hypothetical protein